MCELLKEKKSTKVVYFPVDERISYGAELIPPFIISIRNGFKVKFVGNLANYVKIPSASLFLPLSLVRGVRK